MQASALPPSVQHILPTLHALNDEQKFTLIHLLTQNNSADKPRQLGTLAHKASVTFAKDWEIDDETLIGESL
ncbi:hypothetical protein B0181_05780 [Moraxella caviae]|uniref:DUF2281 domain-containing protein n=1 Tax=Moraxella caviae TaxID=34060 RepID=A0A1T0A303_9GAMM|nr:hypothetical protein [Moraxella caviae]OOR89919.1 hypothetical protein B0181_05780 [Moraxella caviae]STZ14302.1 Uncharacterised protein [Moraxella caviae]VEW12244.1 Uncharacterised protein [Moraxella caviae]